MDIINSIFIRIPLFFTALFLFGCVTLSMHAFVITINDSDDIDELFRACQIPQKTIQSIKYDTDALVSREEFDYLSELFIGDTLTEESIKKACIYIFAKKKFNRIIINLDETDMGVCVFFNLQAYWTFGKTTVTGVLFGKERYASLYGINYGEIFQQLRHADGVDKILKLLRDEGYLEARVQSFFSYDYTTKTVSVRLHIILGTQFRYGGIDIVIDCDEAIHNQEFIQNSLKSFFTKKLDGNYYKKNKLERMSAQMITYLEQEGYVQSAISIREKICNTKKHVAIKFVVAIGSYRQFVFFGNRFFTRKKLLQHIMELGKSAWLVPPSLFAQEILQAYKDKGFLECFVEIKEEKNKCIFLIKEGNRAAVSRMEIKNCNAYSSHYLVKMFFKNTLKKKYFDYETFNKERNSLCDFYIKNGYLDIQVLEYAFIDIASKKPLLVVSLDEGKRYIVSKMILKEEENSVEMPGVLQDSLYLTNNFVNEQRDKVQEYYQALMKRDYTARPEITKCDNNKVLLEWNMRPVYQPQCFGKTVIMSAVDIPYKKIMQERTFNDKNRGDNSLLRSTFSRFKSLDVFDTIFLSSEKLKSSSSTTENSYVLLQLQPDQSYELRLRSGFELKNVSYGRILGEGLGYKLGGSFLIKNLIKKCSIARLNIDLTRFHHEIEAEYRYPWIGNIPIRSHVKGYITKYDQPAFIGSKETLYTAYNNGILCSFHNSKGFFDWNINLGFDWSKTTIQDDTCNEKDCFFAIARAINFKPSLLDIYIPYFFIEPTIYIDYLDDKISPSRGGLTVASVKSMIPLSDHQRPSYFIKLLIEQSLFWPFKKVIAALRVRFGHIFHKDFSRVMPMQRFYLGGSESLRGYERDMAPPLGVYTDDKNHKNIVPKGSKSMININSELRFPLFKKWGAIVFHDAGALANDFSRQTVRNNILMTTGIGVRYQTPIGPLRFDIGWKWYRRYKSEKSFGWYLTVGNAF